MDPHQISLRTPENGAVRAPIALQNGLAGIYLEVHSTMEATLHSYGFHSWACIVLQFLLLSTRV